MAPLATGRWHGLAGGWGCSPLLASSSAASSGLEPAVGALTGLLLLNQHLSPLQWLGITAVALASIGASRGTGKREASTDEAQPPATTIDT
jgi:drug/metabolite transporter (DMT)-like permease